jgi:hypothetical protein
LHAADGVLSTGAAVVAVAFLTLFVALGGRACFDAFLEVVPEKAASAGASQAAVSGHLRAWLVNDHGGGAKPPPSSSTGKEGRAVVIRR